jgi:hypothetical protein
MAAGPRVIPLKDVKVKAIRNYIVNDYMYPYIYISKIIIYIYRIASAIIPQQSHPFFLILIKWANTCKYELNHNKTNQHGIR